ncbi:hypothetical protein M2137_002230 [Parabacteroides sp. PFB2-10]|uniref:6-bladed beta-propeller n=1 Tax=Parabacteroides sp. PFB2-10 TaxID=1742405 RepID=UPI0024740117|nr:6-bladed beta-propeller [Parabacteroides sp. PFB2-10]MDH6313440.1 hypothetical protein [Parabacteroides sp. PFB2-10]MDL2244130.1 6-bladed beta-propeller [Parabacteroides sp. OttesenSCG-928-J18]
MQNKCVYIFLSIFFLFSCAEKGKDFSRDKNVIRLPEKVTIQEVNLSSVASGLKYVALETNDSVLVSSITKIMYENGRIVLVDKDHNCFLFDEDGRFVSKVGRKGNGPNEYMYIRSIDIIPDRNVLFTYDHMLQKLLFYDLEKGDVVNVYKMPNIQEKDEERGVDIRSILYLFNGYYYVDVVSWFDLSFKGIVFKIEDDIDIDKQYHLDVKYPKTPKSLSLTHEVGIMFRGESELRCYKHISDTIFSIDNNLNLYSAYVFKMGKYKATYSYMFDKVHNMEMKYVFPVNIMESSNYLFIEYFFGNHAPEPFEYIHVNDRGEKGIAINRKGYCLWDKSTGESIFLKQPIKGKPGFKNDLDGGAIIWPHYISRNKEIVAFCDADKFQETLTDPSNSPPFVSALIQKVQPDDNPVVIIGKLK